MAKEEKKKLPVLRQNVILSIIHSRSSMIKCDIEFIRDSLNYNSSLSHNNSQL